MDNLRPTFIGIGGHKCASTWLSECMRQHPEIFVSSPKEVAYFSSYYDRGFAWYLAHFKSGSATPQRGEFTSHYLYDPEVADRIYRDLGRVKIIAVIREPVGRALSQIKYAVRHGFLPRPGGASISLKEVRALIDAYPAIQERSFYAKGLEYYASIFGLDCMFVVDQSDCRLKPLEVLQGLWHFLGVDPSFQPSLAKRVVSPGVVPKFQIFESARRKLFYFLNRRAPRAVTLIRSSGLSDYFKALNAGQALSFSNAAADYLRDFFAADWAASQQYLRRFR